jgi:hypothetical protein
MTKDKKYIIAVDFDGVIVEEFWPAMGPVITRTVNIIKKLRAEGHKVILWTCRTGKQLTDALDFCRLYDLEFDAVNENLPETIEKYGGDSRKITADLYFDDRNASFEQIEILAQTGMTEAEYIKKLIQNVKGSEK